MAISWPQYCRAQSAAAAFRTALDLIGRKPTAEVERVLREKIREREAVVAEYLAQVEQKRTASADEEYRRQAAEMEGD